MVCSIRAPLARNLLLVHFHMIYYDLDAAESELQVHDHETNSHMMFQANLSYARENQVKIFENRQQHLHHSCELPSTFRVMNLMDKLLHPVGYWVLFVRIFLKKDSLHLISVLVYIHPFLKLMSL